MSSSVMVDLDQASAGMVLAEALLDAHGAVLLPPGAVLSESSLSSLRRRGVERCSVVAPEPEEDPAVAAARREQALKRLQHLFRRSAQTEATGELLRLLADYRSRS
ncbi:hypothetical protein ASC94_28440 [Massilia sp. Root418]|uniref:hypothetical protein n=1 Tax=Massilia sp. Root418 TaxID=1736532 RepID=UPI0006F874B6|nr:hypothetical protein [Massilia sp. Root418]KQW87322.1 hypothetical protein ASC94_28440 [Massilia sp. Root418]